MSNVVISVENLSKRYDLGVIGTGTISRDLNRWWARMRGKPDPYAKIGEENHGNRAGESIWALKDVSFQVEQGEVLGIIGRNGAGKSTLLKILSQVTAPTSGVVKVKGRVGSLLEVGTGFHPELTGRENVYLNGAILGMSHAEVDQKFDEIVDFAGIEKFIDTPVKRFSSGMYVRLAFAVAAHLNTDILVVDEVLAVGDAIFQKKCLGKMGNVANEGRTVLFVSHNMGSVRNLCPHSFFLNTGTILGFGETDEIIKQYLSTSYSKNDAFSSSKVDCTKLDHSGSGEARITWAKLKNSKGEGTINLDMKDGFQIEFEIKNPLQLNLNFAIEIWDKNDYPLYHFLSEYEETEISFGDKKNMLVRVHVPPLYLFPDMYYINLWSGMHHNRVDKVDKCFRIRILKDTTIKRELLTIRGRFYNQCKWKIYHDGCRNP